MKHPRKPGKWWGLACAVGLLIGLVVFAPARWLAHAVAQASQGRVQLVNPQGTVWRGQADVVLSGGPGSQQQLGLPGGLHWQLQPRWSGIGPALQLQLRAPCCTPTPWAIWVHWQSGAARLALQNSTSSWPVEWLAGLGTPWNTINLQGRLHLQTTELEWLWRSSGKHEQQGSLKVQALDLASSLSTLRPLGSYELQLTPNALQLRTLKGDLALTGQGHWDAGRFRFQGWAEANAASVSALSNLLNILGRRDGLRAQITF